MDISIIWVLCFHFTSLIQWNNIAELVFLPTLQPKCQQFNCVYCTWHCKNWTFSQQNDVQTPFFVFCLRNLLRVTLIFLQKKHIVISHWSNCKFKTGSIKMVLVLMMKLISVNCLPRETVKTLSMFIMIIMLIEEKIALGSWNFLTIPCPYVFYTYSTMISYCFLNLAISKN